MIYDNHTPKYCINTGTFLYRPKNWTCLGKICASFFQTLSRLHERNLPCFAFCLTTGIAIYKKYNYLIKYLIYVQVFDFILRQHSPMFVSYAMLKMEQAINKVFELRINLSVLSSLISKSHTSFFPSALSAPQMPVFHPVNFAAFLAVASKFSVSVMAWNSCRRSGFCCSLCRLWMRELWNRMSIPVEPWMLQRAVCWRCNGGNSWFRPWALYHVKMRLCGCRRWQGKRKLAFVVFIIRVNFIEVEIFLAITVSIFQRILRPIARKDQIWINICVTFYKVRVHVSSAVLPNEESFL